MAMIRVPIQLPAVGVDGRPAMLFLQDNYAVNGERFDAGDTIATDAGMGHEQQWMYMLLEMVWRQWNADCVGLLNTTQGSEGGGSESGSISFGTVA